MFCQSAQADLAPCPLQSCSIVGDDVALRPRPQGANRGNMQAQVFGLVTQVAAASGRCPDTLKVVEAAHFRPEQVNNQVARIDQHPVGIRQALDPRAPGAKLLDPALYMIGQRSYVPGRAAGGDDHRVGKGGFPGEVQDEYVLGLVVLEARQNGLGNGVTLGFGALGAGLTL